MFSWYSFQSAYELAYAWFANLLLEAGISLPNQTVRIAITVTFKLIGDIRSHLNGIHVMRTNAYMPT